MKIDTLDKIAFEAIVDCFLEAFEGYFVQMPKEVEYYRKRWKAARVRYDLSYGMFDDGKLVGFIINGIDRRNGHNTAFNTGTGVIPSHRGKKIVKQIYDYAIPQLKDHGITKCVLEVVSENEVAIKSYKSVGFKIVKKYRCYKGSPEIKKQYTFSLNEVTYNEVNWNEIPNQNMYSWDFHNSVLNLGSHRFFYVMSEETKSGFFAIELTRGYLAQFEVFEKTTENWNKLFSAVKQVYPIFSINNVDERLADKINAIENIHLKPTVNQYEMEMEI